MGWQPGMDSGRGESPDRDPGVSSPMRDPRLTRFAGDGSDGFPAPSGELALLADELSGPRRRCPGSTDNELVGLLRSWAALESWAASAKLGVVRELIRRDGVPSPGSGHGDLPDAWSQSLRYELAGALACSTQSAETTAWLAWEQEARLPGIGALLDDGALTFAKARAVTETFRFLTDADAATAEAMIAGQLSGKTYPQVLRLAEQAALTVDPELAERRREQAQRRDARVSFFREQAGTAALSGRDLPPDEALAAMSSVNARADEYKESDAFGGTRMDVLRAYAYLDLLNGVPAEARIASAEPQDEAAEAADDLAWAEERADKARADKARSPKGAAAGKAGPGSPRASEEQFPPDPPGTRDDPGTCYGNSRDARASDCEDATAGPREGEDASAREGNDEGGRNRPGGVHPGGPSPSGAYPSGGTRPDRDGPDRDRTGRDRPDGNRPDGVPDGDSPDPGGPAGSPRPAGPRPGLPATGEPRPPDLIVPLATLLGLAERPGEIQGFGLLDPALARDLAAAATASPDTKVCVTVTSPEGYAIAHGCARPSRLSRPSGTAPAMGIVPPSSAFSPAPPTSSASLPASLAGLPARLNLTIPASALRRIGSYGDHNGRAAPWAFTPFGDRPPPNKPSPPAGPTPPAGIPPPEATSPPGTALPGAPPPLGTARPTRTATPRLDGHGTWELAFPDGRLFTVRLDLVPVYDCDHRYETRAYQPTDKLRHLVQVRDGTCTFPSCNRHARDCDFEHAIPYDQGGKTCTCNAGARSRACHHVKQTPGWDVTQPRPGWHQWTTPAGRVYTQEPKRYPA